jgi:hypothetical protein
LPRNRKKSFPSLIFLFLKLVQINFIFPDNIHNIFDRLRSTSTPQIGIHWRHYLKSRTNLRVFSNWCPFQVLRSMSDLLLSNRRPFQSEDLYVLLPCHMMDVGQVCTSSALHIISNECKTHKTSSSTTLLFKQVLKQNLIAMKIQNGWAVDAFRQFLCRFPCSILWLILNICVAYEYLLLYSYSSIPDKKIETKATYCNLKNNCNDSFVLHVF